MNNLRSTLALLVALSGSCCPAWGLGIDTPTEQAAGTAPVGGEKWTAVIDGKEVPAPAIPMGDDATVRAILDEGKNRNQVMAHLTYLSKEIGPRLTGSANAEAANRWCEEQYRAWGLANPRIEQWGEVATRFDRGPSAAKVLLRREKKDDDGEVTSVEYEPLRDIQFTTLAWTKGTDGPRRGPVIKQPATEEEFEAMKGDLEGAWILIKARPPAGQRGFRSGLQDQFKRRMETRKKAAAGESLDGLSLLDRLALEPVAGFISTGRDERIWTGGAPDWRARPLEEVPDDVHAIVRLSDYDFINSRISDKEPIEVEIDANNVLTPGPIPTYNTIAEIVGTEFPDEVIIISAHLDSWDGPGSEGSTDNGTGSSVTLEAARILAAVNAKPKRTIRFVNWTGEEQGLLGSEAYVESIKDHWPNISACFVDDGGTNYQGGLGAADFMVEFLAAATAPINNQFYSETDKKWLNVNIRHSGKKIETHGSSDHASFNAVGIPGFFWDETGRADYGYGWHTQHDTLELAIPEYLIQSATNSALVAYRLACAPSLLPREGELMDKEPVTDDAVEDAPADAPKTNSGN